MNATMISIENSSKDIAGMIKTMDVDSIS